VTGTVTGTGPGNEATRTASTDEDGRQQRLQPTDGLSQTKENDNA